VPFFYLLCEFLSSFEFHLHPDVVRAIDHDNVSVIHSWLLDTSCCCEDRDNTPMQHTALTRAASVGSSKCLQLLLDVGVNLNARAANGATALLLSAQLNMLGIMQLLIENGANVNLSGPEGFSALMLATKEGRKDAMDLLIKAGANTNTLSKQGMPVLHVAAALGNSECMGLLLRAGATVNAAASPPSPPNTTALALAARRGHTACVRQLVNVGAHVDTVTDDGFTPLFGAARGGYDAVLQILLDGKSSPGQCYSNAGGINAVMIATQNNHIGCLKMLLSSGASPNAPMNDGCTAVHFAAQHRHSECLQLLITAGANLNDTKKVEGTTALLELIQSGENAPSEPHPSQTAPPNTDGKGKGKAAGTSRGKGRTTRGSEPPGIQVSEDYFGGRAEEESAGSGGQISQEHDSQTAQEPPTPPMDPMKARAAYRKCISLLVRGGSSVNATTREGEVRDLVMS
jgi:ankyrin repeat protein